MIVTGRGGHPPFGSHRAPGPCVICMPSSKQTTFQVPYPHTKNQVIEESKSTGRVFVEGPITVLLFHMEHRGEVIRRSEPD